LKLKKTLKELNNALTSKQFISKKRDRKRKKDVKCLRLLYITKNDPNTEVNSLIKFINPRQD